MSKLVILDHPLIQHKIAIARDKNTGSGLFRQLVKEISMLQNKSENATRQKNGYSTYTKSWGRHG